MPGDNADMNKAYFPHLIMCNHIHIYTLSFLFNVLSFSPLYPYKILFIKILGLIAILASTTDKKHNFSLKKDG